MNINLSDLRRLWAEYSDETLEEATFGGFMLWLQDLDTDPNRYRYNHGQGHVEGRRIACLNKTQILELLDEVDPLHQLLPISTLRKRIEEL